MFFSRPFHVLFLLMLITQNICWRNTIEKAIHIDVVRFWPSYVQDKTAVVADCTTTLWLMATLFHCFSHLSSICKCNSTRLDVTLHFLALMWCCDIKNNDGRNKTKKKKHFRLSAKRFGSPKTVTKSAAVAVPFIEMLICPCSTSTSV